MSTLYWHPLKNLPEVSVIYAAVETRQSYNQCHEPQGFHKEQLCKRFRRTR